MIRFTKGNIFNALQFKQCFPANFASYAEACRAGELVPGRMHLFDTRAPQPRYQGLHRSYSRHRRRSLAGRFARRAQLQPRRSPHAHLRRRRTHPPGRIRRHPDSSRLNRNVLNSRSQATRGHRDPGHPRTLPNSPARLSRTILSLRRSQHHRPGPRQPRHSPRPVAPHSPRHRAYCPRVHRPPLTSSSTAPLLAGSFLHLKVELPGRAIQQDTAPQRRVARSIPSPPVASIGA